MKFRIFFSFSKTESKLRLRFWKWDIWQLDPDFDFENAGIFGNADEKSGKAGFLSFKKDADETETEEINISDNLLFQALFYPDVEERLLAIGKKLSVSTLNLFSVRFENLEISGSLGDPFYDAITLGASQGSYYPCWENDDADWSAKGELVLKSGFFHMFYFSYYVSYSMAKLAFILWRGAKHAKKNPNGEDLSSIRRWIFLRTKEAM